LISSYTTTRNDFNFCSSAQTKVRKKLRKVVDKSNNKLQKLLPQTVQSIVNKTTTIIILCCYYNNNDEEQSSSCCIGWHSVCDVDGISYRLACPTNNRERKKDHKEQELVSIWNDKPDSKISEALLPTRTRTVLYGLGLGGILLAR
jgi:hypothetical protein